MESPYADHPRVGECWKRADGAPGGVVILAVIYGAPGQYCADPFIVYAYTGPHARPAESMFWGYQWDYPLERMASFDVYDRNWYGFMSRFCRGAPFPLKPAPTAP